jgi:hypothetical protein
MTLVLSVVDEPLGTRRSLASAAPDVRRASIRQASDIVTPIYQEWKTVLKSADVSWPSFQAAASENWRAWSEWVDGTIQWRQALDSFLSQIKVPAGTVLSLA